MMEGWFQQFLMVLTVISVVIFGFAIKMLFKKDGEFKGGCAANNPLLVNEIGECGVCGKKVGDEACDNSDSDLPRID